MVWADREVSHALGWRVAISCSSTPVSPGEGGLEFTQLLTKVGWCLFFFFKVTQHTSQLLLSFIFAKSVFSLLFP